MIIAKPDKNHRQRKWPIISTTVDWLIGTKLGTPEMPPLNKRMPVAGSDTSPALTKEVASFVILRFKY